MNDVQERVVKLLDNAEPKENLQKWVNGYIPKHYKRLSIPMNDAIEIAVDGAAEAMSYFNTKLYFTQSLLFGGITTGRYKKFIVVTSSQYGKSWLCGQIGLWLANMGRKAYVSGGNSNTTEIIMSKTIEHIQNADIEITSKLLEPADKIEKLQTSLSKRKLSFRGGGSVESLSLGDTFNNPLKSNQAVGRGGDFIVDEASLISDDAYAEMGRREFANEDGDSYISFEISNPHNPGRFIDKLTAENIPADTLVVWMDIRTAFEEGRVKSKEQVIESEFFANKSTCTRYLLCELEDYSIDSLFSPVDVDDSELAGGMQFFLGVDSAHKGKDDIEAVLGGMNSSGDIRVLDHVTIKKDNWIDGVTSKEIIKQLLQIIITYNVKYVCVDIGYGVYVVEGLASEAKKYGFVVEGINFGSGTTKFRKEKNHYAAVYGSNMRAELHLDLVDLIEHHKVSMTSDMRNLLKEEMNAVQGLRVGNGEGAKTAIIPKKEIKAKIGRSPDKLDAALLMIHAAILSAMKQKIFLHKQD